MCTANRRSAEDFRENLIQQLGFLKNSCRLYDDGGAREAIRIAAVIRTLVHSTKNMTSLLKHLGAEDIHLFTVCEDDDVQMNEGSYWCLIKLPISKGTVKRIPNLDAFSTESKTLSVPDWWKQVVYINGTERLSRKDIVLTAADKDGGVHVDEKLPPGYEALKSPEGIGEVYIHKTKDVRPVTIDAHLPMIRTMAHELLSSPELLKLAE